MNLRKRTWALVDISKPGAGLARIYSIAFLGLIFLNVVAVIVGTVAAVQKHFGTFLHVFEIFSVIVFSAEYLARLWSCVEDPRFRRPITGRIRYALQGMTIVDLLSILPFYLPFIGIDLRSLRALRLFRILWVVKIGHYYTSLNLIKEVLRSKKEEMVLTTALMGLLLVVASTLLYFCENAAQPDSFSSIPATMWWAVSALTTVGYGDICPVTILGKFCASVIAMLGIGMFALPTGILGAGFVEAIQKNRQGSKTCPHCGKEIL